MPSFCWRQRQLHHHRCCTNTMFNMYTNRNPLGHRWNHIMPKTKKKRINWNGTTTTRWPKLAEPEQIKPNEVNFRRFIVVVVVLVVVVNCVACARSRTAQWCTGRFLFIQSTNWRCDRCAENRMLKKGK